MQTILQMVQQTEAELGLPQSTTVYGGTGTTDNTGIQMGALANRVLDELRRMNRWTAMQFEFDFELLVAISTTGNMAAGSNIITGIPSTAALQANYFSVTGAGLPQAARIQSVDNINQVTLNMFNTNSTTLTGTALKFGKDTYAIPADFDWFNNDTMWDRTNQWKLFGPDSPQLDQWERSGIVPSTPRRHFRKLGPFANTYRLWPPPFEISNPLQLVFEYLSLNAVQATGGTYKQYFTADSDVPLLDDQAIIMGIKWMFWEIKGFGSYVTQQGRWVDYVNRLIARDGAAPVLSLSRHADPMFISPANVPDGNWPGPGN